MGVRGLVLGAVLGLAGVGCVDDGGGNDAGSPAPAASPAAPAPQPLPGSWSATSGAMATPRSGHHAVVLGSGKVLVIGGFAGGSGASLASCELYDPATDRWTTTGSMAAARNYFGVALTTSGRVLAVGGATTTSSTSAACELYDPATGTWTATGALAAGRNSHSVAALPGGRVLAVAGNGATQGLASAEVWDPTTGTWSAAGALPSARTGQAAAALLDGRVLVCGGLAAATGGGHAQSVLADAHLYDPTTGTWTTAGAMATARRNFSLTSLPDGRILAAGGDPNDNYTIGTPALAACELFHPTGGGWSQANAMTTGRFWHAASAPSGGGVAVAGGTNWFWTTSNPGPTAERWDIATNRWQLLPALPASVSSATLTPLPSGTLLLVSAAGSWRY